MAASTITLKFSPKEYAQLKRWLSELENAKYGKAKRSGITEVGPVPPQERHDLQTDALAIRRFNEQI